MLLLRLKPSDRNRIQESRYKVSCKSVFCSTSQFLLYQGLYWLRKRRGWVGGGGGGHCSKELGFGTISDVSLNVYIAK